MRIIMAMIAALVFLSVPAGAVEQLTLKQCLDRVSGGNRALQLASHDIGIAQQQIQAARSGYLPKADLQAGFVAQLAPQAVNFGLNTQQTQDADFPFLSLGIYQTIYDFGRTRARVGIAEKRRDAATHSYSGTQQDLFLEVVRAYYGILEAEKLVTATQDEVVQMTAHQQTAQALFDQGVVTRNDLLQAEVRVAASRQRVYSAQNAVANGWLLLNFLLGTPPDFRANLQEEPQALLTATLTRTPDISRRGEIAALRDSVAARDLAVKEAKTNYFPEFYARLALDYVRNREVREQTIMSGTVGLRVNLFDGFATTARVRQAVQERSRDEVRLKDLEERVKLELASAQNDLKVADARIQVAQKAINQALENLRITRDRYQEKVGTATEVVDAQTLLTQTRTDYFQSVFDLQVAAARVRRASGEL